MRVEGVFIATALLYLPSETKVAQFRLKHAIEKNVGTFHVTVHVGVAFQCMEKVEGPSDALAYFGSLLPAKWARAVLAE